MVINYNELLNIYNLLEKITNYKSKMACEEKNIQDMLEVYKLVKESLPCFFKDGKLNKYYGRVIGLIMTCEARLPKKFIIDSNPNFDYYKLDTITKSLPIEDLLDNIVLRSRKELLMTYSVTDPNEDIKKMPFTNDCYKSSKIVQEICDNNDIKSYMIDIHPGFSKKDNICDGNGFHYFNIIEHKDNYYLIDCTYRQFFRIKGNIIEKIGIINMPGCYPGTFMTKDDKRLKVAEKILKDGWIKLDEDILKHYLDGFAISYRNGIYYAQTKDYSYKTSYNAEDYIRFLKEEDSQINHEGKEALGFQKRLI